MPATAMLDPVGSERPPRQEKRALSEVEQPHEMWPIVEHTPEHEPDMPPDLSQEPDECQRCEGTGDRYGRSCGEKSPCPDCSAQRAGEGEDVERVLASVQEVLERDDPCAQAIALAGVKRAVALFSQRAGEPTPSVPDDLISVCCGASVHLVCEHCGRPAPETVPIGPAEQTLRSIGQKEER